MAVKNLGFLQPLLVIGGYLFPAVFYTPLYAENPPSAGSTTPFTKLDAPLADYSFCFAESARWGSVYDFALSLLSENDNFLF